MNDHKYLPFEYKSFARMYHYTAFFSGIVQANAKTDITPWLCGTYINCDFRSTCQINRFNYDVYSGWGQDEGVLIRKNAEISPLLAENIGIDFADLFRTMLDAGMYVYGIFNESCIPGKETYQKDPRPNDFLLTGYDDRLRVFHSAGYLSPKIYSRFSIPYDCLHTALQTLETPQYLLSGILPNPDFEYSLHLHRIIRETEGYLLSVRAQGERKPNECYGLDAVEALAAYYEGAATCGESIPYLYTRAFMEHKSFWVTRLSYLKKIGIPIPQKAILDAKKVYDTARRLHDAEEEQFQTLSQKTKQMIADGIRTSTAAEKAYLSEVVEILKKETVSS